jgi:hypothetical protein
LIKISERIGISLLGKALSEFLLPMEMNPHKFHNRAAWLGILGSNRFCPE